MAIGGWVELVRARLNWQLVGRFQAYWRCSTNFTPTQAPTSDECGSIYDSRLLAFCSPFG